MPQTVWLCPPDQQPADQLPLALLDRLTVQLTAHRTPTSRPLAPLIRTVTAPADLTQLPEWAALLVPGRLLVTVSRNRHRPGGRLCDLAGATVSAAGAAGLTYRQHLVLVETGRARGPHTDVLLFTRPGGRP